MKNNSFFENNIIFEYSNNAAGYHPGPVLPSGNDTASLSYTHCTVKSHSTGRKCSIFNHESNNLHKSLGSVTDKFHNNTNISIEVKHQVPFPYHNAIQPSSSLHLFFIIRLSLVW